jgi:hypothetical protein
VVTDERRRHLERGDLQRAACPQHRERRCERVRLARCSTWSPTARAAADPRRRRAT